MRRYDVLVNDKKVGRYFTYRGAMKVAQRHNNGMRKITVVMLCKWFGVTVAELGGSR